MGGSPYPGTIETRVCAFGITNALRVLRKEKQNARFKLYSHCASILSVLSMNQFGGFFLGSTYIKAFVYGFIVLSATANHDTSEGRDGEHSANRCGAGSESTTRAGSEEWDPDIVRARTALMQLTCDSEVAVATRFRVQNNKDQGRHRRR